MYYLLILVMYGVWPSVYSLGKMALEHSPPLFLTASRMLLAGVILLGYLLFRNRAAFKITLKQFLSLCLFAVFGIYCTNAFEFWSLQHLTTAKVSFIYSLCPFFSALFSYLHFKEKMNGRKWIGMGIGFLGFIPVLAMQKGAEELVGGIGFISWPELAMVGAALCTSYGWILLRLLVKDSVSYLTVNGISMLIGGLLALTHSYLVEAWDPLPVHAEGVLPFAKGILIMTFISNILCYNLYGVLLKRFTATFVSFMGLLSPIFTSFNGWLFLNEQPSPIIFFSTAIVMLGSWMVYSAELKQGYIRKGDQTATQSAA